MSTMESRQAAGKGRKPWWTPKSVWDMELELDIEIHRMQMGVLARSMCEVRALWREVELDSRRRSQHLLAAPRGLRGIH